MASKKSPRRIPEAQRHTEQVKLRLPPDVAREIRALSAASGVQVSTLVALAWAVARRSGGLAAALATVARVGHPRGASGVVADLVEVTRED